MTTFFLSWVFSDEQLRIGMDLHRVTFPTFVLEPRSMLERIADFMSHPELIFGFVILIPSPLFSGLLPAETWVVQRKSMILKNDFY